MRLSQLLAALPDACAPSSGAPSAASQDPLIRGISYDSRTVAPGDLFVALRGETSDGHDYLAQAVSHGAVALLLEQAPDASPGDVAVRTVANTRRALAPIACRFYGEPADECRLVGVTGTNGKTSTTYLVESILQHAGARTGLIGTLGVRYAGEALRTANTTPESLDLQRALRDMRTRNVEAVVMEVSSHGLELGRVEGVHFQVGGFTNLTQDHLDFHGTMDAYLDSKARLFRHHLIADGHAVINVDDPAGDKLAAVARDAGARVLRVSRSADASAEVRLLSADISLGGSRARVALPSGELELELPLVGDFNLENLLVACGIAQALELPTDAIRAGVADCPQVPGRVERVEADAPSQPTVIVDYAHTPDAVEKLLAALRPLARGRLVTLFGCGGDRDRAKRPLMAAAVARHSDRVVATSDNPRTEDPEAILRDVESGLEGLRRVDPGALPSADRAYCVLVDRRAAIRVALASAGPDDTVVLAGKGHEDYQIIGRDKLPFDDREEALRALREAATEAAR